MIRKIVAGLAVAALPAALPAPASAQTPAEFYKGKDVKLTVGYPVGGANDAYARMLGRHIGKYIPGTPRVIVQNMPGGGGLVHMNYMYNVAPKDGTAIGATNQFTAFQALFRGKDDKIQYEARKFNWLGSPMVYSGVAIAWHTAPVKTGEDLLSKELLIGASGISSSSVSVATGLKNVLGFKYRIITGYPGGADVDLAIERGEVHGRSSINWDSLTTRNADWVKEKKINVLYQMGLKKNPEIPADVPLILDFAKTKEQRQLLELMFASYGVGFPLMAPPETPKDRVAALREALAQVYKDAGLISDAKQWPVAPVSGEEVQAIIENAYATPTEIVERMRAAYQNTGTFEKVKPKVLRAELLTVAAKGSAITFKEAQGNTVTVKISGKQTKITMGGETSERAKLAAGKTCEITYFGDQGQAQSIACE